jgi:hypothetical protein
MVSVKNSKIFHLKVPCPRRSIKYQPFFYHFHSHRLPAVRRIGDARLLSIYIYAYVGFHLLYFIYFFYPCLHKNFTKNRHNKIKPLRTRYFSRAFPSKKRRVLFTIPTYEWFAFLILSFLGNPPDEVIRNHYNSLETLSSLFFI